MEPQQESGQQPEGSPQQDTADPRVEVVSSLAEVDAAAWDACANPPSRPYDPFISHAFLNLLEEAGCVAPEKGWLPVHMVMRSATGEVQAAMPCYMKSHSQGEFVFDHSWADAYTRAGGRYYPKLLSAVPFTPVPGARILVPDTPDARERETIMGRAAVELARRQQVSSLHVNFLPERQWRDLTETGFLARTDQQFHFPNPGYDSFAQFLETLASRKRKAVRKERQTALEPGIEIEWLTGGDITEAHWDAFYGFYQETGARKWGRPYLNRKAFSLIGERMAKDCLLVMAKRAGRYVAGAMNMIGGDCLYGRYWGAVEHHPCLHFEVCYYQAIDYAVQHRLPRVEAGAQGEHKLARGYVPTVTYSAHWIADPGLRDAVARYLTGERRYVEETRELLTEFGPYRKTSPGGGCPDGGEPR